MEKKNVEAIYPLTPMQQGLLFHSLQSSGEDPGALHLRCRLEGRLEPDRFAEAWEEVVRRHPILRTALRWKGLDEPLQIVLRTVDVPWTIEDWRAHRPLHQQERLQAYLDADRERGIDLGRLPVMRLALFQTDELSWQLVWSCHHVLIDGWSGALVLQDVIAFYNAMLEGRAAAWAPAPPFQSYVRWLKRQPDADAEAFWRDYLGRVTGPTPLPFEPPGAEDRARGAEGYGRQEAEVPAHVTASLQALARRYQLTLSTLLHGAWALLLSRYSDQNDVVFGSTTSGRAVDLPGIEAMAGLLINTLPIRVHVGDATALDVFRALHDAQADQVRFAYSSPAQIQSWSDVPAHQRLFESLLVIENYPHATAAAGPLAFHDLQSGITSNYPLTLIINPGDTLHLHVIYDRRRFGQTGMTRLLYDVEHLLERITQAPEESVATLMPEVVVGSAVVRPEVGGPQERSRLALEDYSAPRDETERRLVAIWEDVLNVRPVGVRDGFFDLGGQSMQALHLLNRVEREFGNKLPISMLFETDDIAQMAQVLRGEDETAPWSSLVPLEPEGAGTPLYCIHSFDGQVMFYRDLARHLRPDQPVYGLQAVGLDGTTPPLADVHEMAGRYLEEVRAVQPEGPYAFLSICFGIGVMLEMARRLAEEGEEVTLFVVDSSFDNLRRAHEPELAQGEPPSRLRRIVAMVRDGSLVRELPDHLAIRGRRLQERMRLYTESRDRAAEGPQELRLWQVTEACKKAWDAYRATPYAGAVTLLRSSAFSGWDIKQWHVPVWTEIARGGLTVHTVPGNHADMLREPYVQALAAQVQADLDAGRRTETEAAPGSQTAHS